MNRRISQLIRIGLFAALPLAGGAAFAQGSATSSSTATTPSGTDDTRTQIQQKAGKVDDTQPALPGDATQPTDIPNTVPQSDRSGLPDVGSKSTNGMTTPGSGATDQDIHKGSSSSQSSDETIDETTTKRSIKRHRPSSGAGNLDRSDVDRKSNLNLKNDTMQPDFDKKSDLDSDK